jgi:transposase
MATYYIGADVHSNNIQLAVRSRGKIIDRRSLPTAIPALAEFLDSLRGTKHLAIEEGPMAGWLYRNLSHKVDSFSVADPRRNKLISSDGDHDDKIDSAKLSLLLAGGFLRLVYHTYDDRREELKQMVSLYHDRVREAVRDINKIRARARMHGLAIPRKVVRQPQHRPEWLARLRNPALARQLLLLWVGYDATVQQVHSAKQHMINMARHYPVIKIWRKLPGVGLIRAATIFAYLDTPYRFKKKNNLCKYCGVGLERTTSGTDKKGRPRPTRLRLPWRVNRSLKNAVIGAAISAINQKPNPYRNDYERMVRDGVTPSNARHTVARKLLTDMWGIWKKSCQLDTGQNQRWQSLIYIPGADS